MRYLLAKAGPKCSSSVETNYATVQASSRPKWFSVRLSIPALANRALYQFQTDLQQHWHEVGTAAVSSVYSSEQRPFASLRRSLLKVACELGVDQDGYGGDRYRSSDFLDELREERAHQNMMAVATRGLRSSPPTVWYHDELSRRLEAHGPRHAFQDFLCAARHWLHASPEDAQACVMAIWRVARPWEFQSEAQSKEFKDLLRLAVVDAGSHWGSHASQLALLFESQLPPAYQLEREQVSK
ncbi:hypothetical protein EYZ11_012441 [Aspergillus tanneri]|uniref:Uncharacterized protein n=1 Tax=Aspergillus tanneri TaxID=1220188 RepID=A0A4S3J5M1_9EURO|nr:hypothetical protein EYZ11_012441 [Aspergillus tanneri]